MTTEEEALRVIAEVIHGTGNPDVVAVKTFGGGDHGLPGIRVECQSGAKYYLVPDMTGAPARGGDAGPGDDVPPGRPQFLNFVAEALREAQRPEIPRVDSVFAAPDDLCGIKITDRDEREIFLRALSTGVRLLPGKRSVGGSTI